MTATDLSVRANTSATPTVVAVQNGRHGSVKHRPPAANHQGGRVWARRFSTTLLRY
jgi:hypothetical protein